MRRNKIMTMLTMAVWLCCSVALSFAATIELRETGQTGCWDTLGNAVDCPGTGQDAATMRGAAWPSPRFVDNGNGTVTDKLTDLIWLKDASCFGAPSWSNALASANGLANGACGLTDASTAGQWRLPTVNELQSLVNAQQANTATWLNSQGFANVQSYYYWSSTTYAADTAVAWVVVMWSGVVDGGYKDYHNYYVWPVRGGQ